MDASLDAIVDGLLVDWHRWSRKTGMGKGYPTQSASCRDARASRQWDDANGAIESGMSDSTMESVDAAIDRIPQPQRTALCFLARNMATGRTLWDSPRLPICEIERAVVLLEARNRFMKELARNGVLC